MKSKTIDYIFTLFTRFKISDKIDEKSLLVLIEKFKKEKDNISYEDTEKSIACIYLLHNYGIPLKSSALHLSVDADKVFRLFKCLNVPSYNFVGKFSDFLTRFEANEYKLRFNELFEKLKHKSSDPFTLAVALNITLQKDVANSKSFQQKDNTFDYSNVTLAKYRKIIRDELDANID